ncbi:hypothetical protein ACFLZC_00430 [Patescibacteria group bacterium]
MAIKPNLGQYPKDFTFWNNNTKKMVIINGEDFPRNSILKELGVHTSPLSSGFGNADAMEAHERSEMMRYIHEHPKFIDVIRDLSPTATLASEVSFRNYYDPELKHNRFWMSVHNLIDFLASQSYQSLPDRLQKFYDTLASFKGLEADEKNMAKIIGEELASTAVMEGTATITCKSHSWKELDPASENNETVTKYKTGVLNSYILESHGHRTFSFALSEARQKAYPKWLRSNTFRKFIFGGTIGRFVKWRINHHNEMERKKAYEIMTVERFDEIQNDLVRAVQVHLNEQTLEALPALGGRGFQEYVLHVYFSYGKVLNKKLNRHEDGLRFQIYDIEVPYSREVDLSFEFTNFDGYSQKRLDLIGKARANLVKQAKGNKKAVDNSRIRSAVEEADPTFFERISACASPQTDAVHKWNALQNLYEGKDVVLVYRAINDFCDFVHNGKYQLLEMNSILCSVKRQAEKLKTSICFPEIVLDSEENIVEFDDLYPMHLGETLKNGKIVPVNGLPAINGTMVSLTGMHGGGKTVTEHTVTGWVYLAPSIGIVLGKKFRLNPKTHMGMVFIEGISGRSVVQVLLQKTENIFEEIKKVPGKDVLLVLDELGSATQQEAGMHLAMRILRTVHERGISLLFSTQILNVAEEAKKLFGATCFKVNKKHQLSPGIAGGNLDELVKSTKLNKLLLK